MSRVPLFRGSEVSHNVVATCSNSRFENLLSSLGAFRSCWLEGDPVGNAGLFKVARRFDESKQDEPVLGIVSNKRMSGFSYDIFTRNLVIVLKVKA